MHNHPAIGQMDNDALARARYAAYAQRRTMPPRCNPIGILLLVLTLGILFIGLTMTVIANWPGATSIGENPLRVAGPVLLACGGFFFILTIVLIACLNSHQQSTWGRQLTNLAANVVNRMSRDNSMNDDNPYKIRSSTSEGGQEVTSSRGSGSYPIKGHYSVDMLPDPVANPKQLGKLHDVSLDSNDKIPDPMRVKKKRPMSRKSGDSDASFNNSYSSGAGEADLGVPGFLIPSGHRLSQQVSRSNGGYMNASYGSDEGEALKHRSGARNQQKGKSADEKGKAADKGRSGDVPGASNQMRGDVLRGISNFYSGDSQQLRVHIKTQPGTAVHITPSATPLLSRNSHQVVGTKFSDTSGETEI